MPMLIDLTGKTAVITGSTAGIGLAIATGLARAGAAVILNGRTQQAIDRALATLRAAVPGATASGVPADLSTAAGCAALAAAAPGPDILVNNVAVFAPSDIFDTPDAEWDRFFAVNVMSGVRLSRAYLPAMQARGWGRVIFISSESALNIPVDMIHYGMTKAAGLAVSRGLAKRMAVTGVTVNAVLPGPTMSDGLIAAFQPRADATGQTLDQVATDFVKTHRASSILQRAATVEEVANLVVYVASPLSSATTGAALRVDGGVVETIA